MKIRYGVYEWKFSRIDYVVLRDWLEVVCAWSCGTRELCTYQFENFI
jgi:hypothetical protein